MDFQEPGEWDSLRTGIRELCNEFGDTYWQKSKTLPIDNEWQ